MKCGQRIVGLFSLIAFLALTGCGGGSSGYEGPQRSALSGTVTVDGTPLAIGTIGFVSDTDADRNASAPIADGKYLIPEGKGPTYGNCLVVISGSLKRKETLESDEESPAGENVGVESGDEAVEVEETEGGLSDFVSARNTLPAKYNTETELSAEINSPSHIFDFDLKTE